LAGNGAISKPTKKRLLVLDTDHFSALERNSETSRRLTARLQKSEREKALTIITVQETLRGWLAEINRHHDLDEQIGWIECVVICRETSATNQKSRLEILRP
jgi:predicted nucleic acid-binding protein